MQKSSQNSFLISKSTKTKLGKETHF